MYSIRLHDWLVDKCCSRLQLVSNAPHRGGKEAAGKTGISDDSVNPPLCKSIFFDKDEIPYIKKDRADAQSKADGLMIVNILA